MPAPVTSLRFYDEWGSNLVCGTEKGLHVLSIVRDSKSFSWNVSQERIKSFGFPEMKYNDWGSLVSVNSTCNYAEAWCVNSKAQNSQMLSSSKTQILSVTKRSTSFRISIAKCAFISL